MAKTFNWRLLGSALAIATIMGCANSSERPPVGELADGLNLLDVRDPTWGMNAAYLKNGRVVYIESRQGPLKPEIYRQTWPNDPINEMDLRFVNQEGRTFFIQRGGDDLIDPTWEADITAAQKKAEAAGMPMEHVEIDWQLAKEAAAAFGIDPPAGFADHIHALSLFAKEPVPSQNPVMIAKAKRADATAKPAPPEAGLYDYYVPNPHYLETDKYSASTGCFAWICTAKHSATNMWVYSTGWTLAQVACNHGRCPGNLSYNCYSAGGWFYYASYINGDTNSNNVAISGGCGTPYNWNSGGWDHLCNDDAAYELWQAKSGSEWTSQGDRYSFKWNNTGHFACACSNNGGCDGDWNTPNCP